MRKRFVSVVLACGLAAGPGTLIAARFVQGIGGAMASSVTLGMIVRLFTQPDEQRRATAGPGPMFSWLSVLFRGIFTRNNTLSTL